MAIEGARFETYVRAAMKEKGISLAQLSKDSGVDRGVVYAWFRGQSQPRRNTLRPIGDVIDRTPEELLAVWEGSRARPRATERPDAIVEAIERQTAVLERLLVVIAGTTPQVELEDAGMEAEMQSEASTTEPSVASPPIPRGKSEQ